MVEIKLIKHAEGAEQLSNLFRICFNDKHMTAEIWNWEYLQNPFSKPEVIVALDNGRIVGTRPFWFAEMWLGGKKVKAAQHCDTMVHPDYRGKGIFNRMGQFAVQYLKNNDYALSYGFPGPMARPGFLSQGYRIVAETENMFRAVHPWKLLSYKLSNKILAGGLGYFYNTFLNTQAKKIKPTLDSFEVDVSERYIDDLEDVDDLRDKSGISLARSESYLHWRFDKNPEHDYKYVVAKKDGKLWGYAVISTQQQSSGLVHGIIVDYLVKNKNISCFRVLMDRCLNELAQSQCDILLTWAFSEPQFRKELSKCFGFKSSVKFPYNRMFGYAYLEAMMIDEKLAGGVNIYDSNNWQVTHAYWDNV